MKGLWLMKRVRALQIAILIALTICLLSNCASSGGEMSRFARDCDGRFSYVYCPAPPRSYHPKAVKYDGALTQLSDNETKAMAIFLDSSDNVEKIQKLEALGYKSNDGVNSLEYLLCSEYAACKLTPDQYRTFRRDILPSIEND